jgi:hypothetical protein
VIVLDLRSRKSRQTLTNSIILLFKEILERKSTTLIAKIAVDFNTKTALEHSDYFDNIILADWMMSNLKRI